MLIRLLKPLGRPSAHRETRLAAVRFSRGAEAMPSASWTRTGPRALVPALALTVLLASAAPAPAATQVGQLAPPGTPGGCQARNNQSPTFFHLIQQSTSGGPGYVVPAGGGVITSWSHRGGDAGGSLRFKVYRPTADPDRFQIVGASGVTTPANGQVNTYPTRMRVQAGDILGLTVTANGIACQFSQPGGGDVVDGYPYASSDPTSGEFSFNYGGSYPLGGWRLNVAATVEPDVDGDGYGDESQDDCPAYAATQEPCPSFAATEGVQFSGVLATLATYSDPGGECTFSGATTINWGDGTTGPGTLTNTVRDPDTFRCEYTLSGAHTYADDGPYLASAGWTEASTGRTGTMYARTGVADAPITAAGTTILAPPGSSFTGVVGSFTSPDPNDTAGTYTASIDWGDGTPATAGNVTTNGSGGFNVSGSHTYAAGGSSTVTVTITGDGGATGRTTTSRTSGASESTVGAGPGGGPGGAGGSTDGATVGGLGAPTGLGLTFAKQKLPTALTKGFALKGGCAQNCLVEAQLVVSGKLAKRLRLSKQARATVVAKGSALAPAGGKALVRLKFTAKAKWAFKKLRSIKLSLVGVPSNAAGSGTTAKRTVTLRR